MEVVKAFNAKTYVKMEGLSPSGGNTVIWILQEDFKEAVMQILGVTAIGDGKTNPFYKKTENTGR